MKRHAGTSGSTGVSHKKIHLVPRPPFDFSRSSAIFSRGDPQIRLFRDGVFRQPLATAEGPLLAEVRSDGTTEKPGLVLTLYSERSLSTKGVNDTGSRIAAMLSLADDLVPFYAAVAADPILLDLTVQLRGVKAPVTPTVFEALADSIIEQQISLHAARSIENRLIRLTGQQVIHDGMIYYCYPEPSALAATNDRGFRSCGLTLRKGEYLRDISRSIVAGDLDVESFRDSADTESIISEMIHYRGIGRWTAELTILRGLHRPDAFPADDVGVRRFISQVYLGGSKISSADARRFAETLWGPWKGFAAYYLEVADLLGIQPRTG
jgi:DNA-3-methyladenine glycosylase II